MSRSQGRIKRQARIGFPFVGIVVAALLHGACAQKPAPDGAQATAASAVPSASASAAPRAANTGALPPPPAPMGSNGPATDPIATIFGGMSDELKGRPNVHPNVDDAFTALTKAGVVVPAPAQSLARTYKAAFCKHGLTTDQSISILLCEYADEARAGVGLEESKKAMASIKTRTAYGHKTLMMATNIQGELHPAETAAAQKKAVATFNAL